LKHKENIGKKLWYNTFFLDQYPEEIKTEHSCVSYWHSDLTTGSKCSHTCTFNLISVYFST